MSDDMWEALAQRVALNRFSGATAEDDDALAAADLREALLNPNRQGAGGAGMGGPGMMPPMMMGGMGRGGGEAGGGGATGSLSASAPAAAPGPAPAMRGGTPLTAAPEAAGAGVGSAEAAPDLPSLGGGGGGLPGGMPGGGSGGGLGGDDLPLPDSALGSGAATTPPDPGASGPTPATQPPADGFSADPTQIKGLSDRWLALAQQLRATTPPAATALGISAQADRPYQALTQQLDAWLDGAATEFDAIVDRLRDVGAGYSTVDDEGAAQVRRESNA